MADVTIVLSDDEHKVPGIDCAPAESLLAELHPYAARWIQEQRAESGESGKVVLADEGWANPGGYESLTLLAAGPDLARLREIRRAARRDQGAA